MDVDTTQWSGEGEFTALLVEKLRAIAGIDAIRVENAPASRAESDYNFISNELFITFAVTVRHERVRRFGILPGSRAVTEKAMNIPHLEQALTNVPEVGGPDYSDEAMLQYLRAERIIPPYQTRGYKLVELVRIYESGTERRA